MVADALHRRGLASHPHLGARSKVPAEQGRLTIFASGPEEARQRVEPVFAAIGERTVWVGPVGTGSRMKLVNNTLLAFGAEGVANSLALAHRLGLETRGYSAHSKAGSSRHPGKLESSGVSKSGNSLPNFLLHSH